VYVLEVDVTIILIAFSLNILWQLLFTRNITVESGNCCDFDALEDDILEFRSDKRSVRSVQEETTFDDDESEIQT